MRNYILFLIVLLALNSWSQESEYYFVTAKSGLNVRAESNLTSKKIAKIPYGVSVEKIADTGKEFVIKDNGKQVTGQWVKVKFNNYGYLVSKETEQFEAEGYVFDGFLQKIGVVVTNTKSITQLEYNKLLQSAVKSTYNPKKIEDLDSIKVMLKNRVTWVTEFEDEDFKRDDAIKSIITDNGQELICNKNSLFDVGFSEGWSGYYPEEGILILEGGHSSDMCFSIKTGETDATIGNPMNIIPSPKGTYRLNGVFGGQECTYYFIQKKDNNAYKYLGVLDKDPCMFEVFYWISEHEFIYKQYFEEEYYSGEIKE